MKGLHVPPVGELADLIGVPLDRWHGKCHGVSLAVVQAELFPRARVARGWCRGVAGQHSWVILSDDPYADRTVVIDPTLWTYDPAVPDVHVSTVGAGRHRPHGYGPSLFAAGRPRRGSGPVVRLSDAGLSVLSAVALSWVELMGPLDLAGWSSLAHGTMVGWPAGEVLHAMHLTRELKALVPIDLIGMLTDLNPHGLYLPGPDRTAVTA